MNQTVQSVARETSAQLAWQQAVAELKSRWAPTTAKTLPESKKRNIVCKEYAGYSSPAKQIFSLLPLFSEKTFHVEYVKYTPIDNGWFKVERSVYSQLHNKELNITTAQDFTEEYEDYFPAHCRVESYTNVVDGSTYPISYRVNYDFATGKLK